MSTNDENGKRFPTRERLPDTRKSITSRFCFPKSIERVVVNNGVAEVVKEDFVGYITVGLYEDGRPGEIFFYSGKQGDDVRIYDALMVVISIGLQSGIGLEVFVDKLEHMRFVPNGITTNSDIPLAKSFPDYLAKWLRKKFLNDKHG